MEYKGEVWVFTGDYKTQFDGISTPFEPVQCHTFVTECTFGLPVFRWEKPSKVHQEINRWWAQNQVNKTTSLLMGYSLGKVQRLLKHLDPEIGKIYTHGSTEKMTEVLRKFIDFPKELGPYGYEDAYALFVCGAMKKMGYDINQYVLSDVLVGEDKKFLFKSTSDNDSCDKRIQPYDLVYNDYIIPKQKTDDMRKSNKKMFTKIVRERLERLENER